jgi:hypothetical protein
MRVEMDSYIQDAHKVDKALFIKYYEDDHDQVLEWLLQEFFKKIEPFSMQCLLLVDELPVALTAKKARGVNPDIDTLLEELRDVQFNLNSLFKIGHLTKANLHVARAYSETLQKLGDPYLANCLNHTLQELHTDISELYSVL